MLFGWLRTEKAKTIMAKELSEEPEPWENPFVVGGAAKKYAGSEAKIFTLADGDQEMGHAVVKFRGRYYDAEGSYGSKAEVLRHNRMSAKTELVDRTEFVRDRPDRVGLILHRAAVVKLSRLAPK